MKSSKPSKKRSFSGGSQFLSDNRQKKLAFGFGIGCLVFAIVAQAVTTSNMNREGKVFVLDGTHTLHIGPLTNVSDSPIFLEIALVATQVIFQRSAKGLDLPELLPHLFNDSSAKMLMDDVQSCLPEIKVKNMHQKPEISKIMSLAEKDGLRILQVEGNIVSSGDFGDIPLVEAHYFRIKLVLAPNPNLCEQKRYPFIVSAFNILELSAI